MPRDEAVLLDIHQSAGDGMTFPPELSTPEDLLEQAIGIIQKGDLPAGERRLRQLTQSHPGFLNGWGHLAYTLFVQKQYLEAAECYRKCRDISPDLLEASTREADCLFRGGKRHEANKVLFSLRNSPVFNSNEVQSLLRFVENPLHRFIRRTTSLLARVVRKIPKRGFIVSLIRELTQAPLSLSAIRDSSFDGFAKYLTKGLVDRDLYQIRVGPCDLCGSRKLRNIFYLFDRKVVRCRKCGLERLERIPPGGHDLHTGFYERPEIVAVMEEEWTHQNVIEHHMVWLKAVFFMAGLQFPLAGSRLFEIGCAGGQLLARLESDGMQVAGMDASASFVELAVKHYGLPVSCTTIEALKVSGQPYDIVLSYHVLEHLERPSVLFEKALTLLRPGGYLFVEVPVPNLRRVSRELKRHSTHGYGSCEHSHFFTPETLEKYFQRFGFQVLASYQYLAGPLPNGGILGRKC